MLMLRHSAILERLNSDKSTPLVNNVNYTVTNGSLGKLSPGVWLNDELINAYAFLVNQESATRWNNRTNGFAKSKKTTLCLNTFFMTKLCEEIEKNTYNFSKFSRWIKRQFKTFNELLNRCETACGPKNDRAADLTLADLDTLLVPVNQGNKHWLLMAVDVPNKTISFINSMPTSQKHAEQYSANMNRFMRDYFKNDFAASDSWDDFTLQRSFEGSVPQQTNANDCGVCTCLNMAEISRNPAILRTNAPFSYVLDSQEFFSQRARKLLCLAIIQGDTLSEQFSLAALSQDLD